MFRFKKKNLIYSAVVILLILFLSSLISFLRQPLFSICKYPLSLFNLIRREAGGIIFYHHNFVENEKLKKENNLLRYRLNVLDEALVENKRLKELLVFKDQASFKLVAARVIGRSPENWSSLIIIDKGSNSGIRRGYVVITQLGLIGRVVESNKSISKIMLLNDTNFAVSGMAKRSRQEGLVSGTLGDYLMMKYLPRDCDIKAGDVIITSGLTDLYPKGLLIGTVVEVGREFSGLSRYATIKPAVELSAIEEVLIIIP